MKDLKLQFATAIDHMEGKLLICELLCSVYGSESVTQEIGDIGRFANDCVLRVRRMSPCEMLVVLLIVLSNFHLCYH